MTRYFLLLAYNGTNYNGWQRQPNAPSVQQTLEEALSKLLAEKISIVGCGRTDTGVHASEYIAHFETLKSDLATGQNFIYHLNAILPQDIAIKSIKEVSTDCHARFSATNREYQYFVITKKSPFNLKLAYQYTQPLDIEAMNEMAALLLTHNDFTSFAKLHSDNKTNICSVTKAKWTTQGDYLVFTIEANRFLRNMVRAITGTLIDVGRGKKSKEQFIKILQSCKSGATSSTAPAHGLYLSRIDY